MNSCKICNSKIAKLFQAEILNKYKIEYYRCNRCAFIQTEEPFWLQESYSNAITNLDIGLVGRNLYYSNTILE